MNARTEDKHKNLSGRILFLLKNACASNPCRNNATCQAGFTHRDYQCLCAFGSGFEGHDWDKGEESSKFFCSQYNECVAISYLTTGNVSMEAKTLAARARQIHTNPYINVALILFSQT